MTGRGVTQGDPVSPMIFNIVVDAVVREVLDMVCGNQEAQQGLRWAAGEGNLVLYVGDVRISGWDHECVQDSLMVTVEMLHRMGIETNLDKTNFMVFTPGFIWGKWVKGR